MSTLYSVITQFALEPQWPPKVLNPPAPTNLPLMTKTPRSPARIRSRPPRPRPAARRTRRRWLTTAVATALCAAGLLGAGQAAPAAAAAVPVVPPPCPVPSGPAPLYLDTHYSFAERAADLVSCLTLAEKIAQLHTNSAPAIPSLGVQQYTYWSEGQHGIDLLGADTDRGGASSAVHATSFPVNFASTMSWDPGLIYQETTAISDEARGFLDKKLWGTGQNNLGPSPDDYGDLTYFAPTINLDRDPRWGRTDEAFGEDPYLASQMADAYIDGYQGETMSGQPLTPFLKVAATAKHYALYDVEDDRMADSSNTDDANIRDYYTAQFRSVTENAHVAGMMTSYNAINGTPSVADTYTTDELDQRTYGFNGYITSDCGAVGTTYLNPPQGHDWAPPGWTTNSGGANAIWTNTATGQRVSGAAGGQAYALRAGTGLNCPGSEDTPANIQQAFGAGVLDQGVIDNALVHAFTARMETGEFNPPSQVPWTKITSSVIQSHAHQALAEKVAADDLVLLQNNDVTGTSAPLLPVNPAALKSVVIVGNLAGTVTLGGYSGDPTLQVDAAQGIAAAVRAASPHASVVYDSCATSTTATTPARCSPQTMADIRSAGLVVVFVGTDENVAREGLDRTSLAMPGNYDSLIDEVAKAGNPRMVLAIQSDGPVTINNVQPDFPAIVFSGYNGESQGTALASVLFGRQDPSGHLDFTWFTSDSQLPAMSNYGLTPAQTGGKGRTYMYFTGTPTYPFGYGLSYTTFAYRDFKAGPGSVTPNGSVRVSFDVTNTGTTPGATVAQLYVRTPFTVAGQELPIKRLEGFQKTRVLAPGQSQRITLTVQVASLSFWDEKLLRQVVYDGPYDFSVGPSSAGLAATGRVTVKGRLTPRVQYVTVQPDQVMFTPGQTLNLTGANPWIAPDTDPALEQRHAPAANIIEAVNNDQSFVNLGQAHVSYGSSNPSVATVSSSGVMTAVGAGVATINVTVNGVTGSTVVVVQQPFAVTAPPLVVPGHGKTVTTALTNPGSTALAAVHQTLTAPGGWTVRAVSPRRFTRVAPGQTATTRWRVTAPAGAAPGPYSLPALATFTGPDGRDTVTGTAQTTVPYRSLWFAYDNPGITSDSDPTAGNLDGDGRSYSEQALAAAGLTRGGPVTHDGLAFTWPDRPPGAVDNVVAGGQTVRLTGSGSTLGILGAANNGTATGTLTVTYTDGSSQTFSLALADWWANAAAPGSDILATMPYINTSSGKTDQKVSVYCATLPLAAGKTVAYVTLPDISDGVSNGENAMHIFTMAIGTPAT
jgi:beta-glucosidase